MVMTLRGELLQLQQALHHTQAALVGKYRGNRNKSVAGAQFRTPASALQPKASALLPTPHKCQNCSQFRTLVRQLRGQEEALLGERETLRAQLVSKDAMIVRQGDLLTENQRKSAELVAANAAMQEALDEVHRELDEVGRAMDAHAPALHMLAIEYDTALHSARAEALHARGSEALHKLERELDEARASAAAQRAQWKQEAATLGARFNQTQEELESAMKTAAAARASTNAAENEMESLRHELKVSQKLIEVRRSPGFKNDSVPCLPHMCVCAHVLGWGVGGGGWGWVGVGAVRCDASVCVCVCVCVWWRGQPSPNPAGRHYPHPTHHNALHPISMPGRRPVPPCRHKLLFGLICQIPDPSD